MTHERYINGLTSITGLCLILTSLMSTTALAGRDDVALPESDTAAVEESPVRLAGYRKQPIKKSAKIYKRTITTYFWVGEGATKDNNFISNASSAWDGNWLKHYGGVDSPRHRCGYKPCAFKPKENPFYVALPYNDLDIDGRRKESAKLIPWYRENSDKTSILKNRWIEIVYRENRCYAQWEDVGPLETDDFDYVFGNSPSINMFGVKAGMDVSPAVWDCLKLDDNDYIAWRFVDESEVPPGPWKETVTRSGVHR